MFTISSSDEYGGSTYGMAINHCEGEEPGFAPGEAPTRQPVVLEIGLSA